MSFKDKLKEIKKILFESDETETNELFVDINTEDGQVLRVNDVAVGEPVEIVEGENLVEAPDGNYVLETGATLVVSGGMIEEVIEAEEEEAETEEEMSEETETESKEEEATEEKAEEEVKENFEDEVLGLMKSLTSEIKSLKDEISSVKAENEEFKKDYEEFKAKPSVEHTETKVSFKENKKQSPVHAVVRSRK